MTQGGGDPSPALTKVAPQGLNPGRGGPQAWWRFDQQVPSTWTWTGFATLTHRFDPLSGRFRVRYAASTAPGAALERFGSHGRRRVTEADAATVLVRLHGDPPLVDLTDIAVRRALGVDERINVGRSGIERATVADPTLDACGRLADRVHDWFGIPPTALLYRSRHDAQLRNMAFSVSTLDAEEPAPHTAQLSRDCEAIAALVIAGVTVPEQWFDDLDRRSHPGTER